MPEIDAKTKIKIVILGFFFSLLGTLMLWALFARIINDFVIAGNLVEGNDILLIIIAGILGITIIVSVVFGILITENISKSSVLKASGVAMIVSLIVLLGLCYFGLALVHPEVYSELRGFEIILAFPSVIMYFSIYVLNNLFAIYIIAIIIYYLFFISFLESFYEYEMNYKHYESIFEQFERRRL